MRLPGNFRRYGQDSENFRDTILKYINNNIEIERFA